LYFWFISFQGGIGERKEGKVFSNPPGMDDYCLDQPLCKRNRALVPHLDTIFSVATFQRLLAKKYFLFITHKSLGHTLPSSVEISNEDRSYRGLII
jgi:hypothetical protein